MIYNTFFNCPTLGNKQILFLKGHHYIYFCKFCSYQLNVVMLIFYIISCKLTIYVGNSQYYVTMEKTMTEQNKCH